MVKLLDILLKISDAVLYMYEEKIDPLIIEALESPYINLEDIYEKGLNNGMLRAMEKLDNKEYFIPEIIVCADTLNRGLSIIEKHGKLKEKDKGKILLAVVEGDTHDIGKNIVKIMLDAAGYEIIDLGANVNLDYIVDKAIEEKVDIIGLSSLMTSTMKGMGKVVNNVKNLDRKNKPKVIIGGGPVTNRFCKKIGADGYSSNAPNAVKLVDNIVGWVQNEIN